jgi:hypothetical protein
MAKAYNELVQKRSTSSSSSSSTSSHAASSTGSTGEYFQSTSSSPSTTIISPLNLAVVEIHMKTFYKMFNDLDPIDEIAKSDEIVCYEVTS